MYTLVINDTEYQLPDKLSVRQWMGIVSLPTNDDYNRNLIKVILGLDDKTAELVPSETLELVASFAAVMFNSSIRVQSNLKTIDFDSIQFGKWIDLDVYLSLGLDKHLGDVVNVLFDIEDGLDRSYPEVIGGVNSFINYRSFIYNQYKNLFWTSGEVESDEPTIKQHPAKSWNNVVISVADDDITKIDQVLDMPLIKVFNFMAHRKEKAMDAYNELQKTRQ